jgi:[ribosomal protein S5]-alanine N-acetyltransferase
MLKRDKLMPPVPTFETDHLILRRLELTDASLIYEYVAERDIAYNTLLIPYPYPAGGAEQWITTTHGRADTGEGFSFAITRKSDGLFVGAIGIGNDQEHKRAEIGYWLGKPFWGQGYMSEAARRVIQFGFETLSLNRIYASHFTRNPASGRVMEKAGMTYEGTLRQNVLKWGEFVDISVYAILLRDWETINP